MVLEKNYVHIARFWRISILNSVLLTANFTAELVSKDLKDLNTPGTFTANGKNLDTSSDFFVR